MNKEERQQYNQMKSQANAFTKLLNNWEKEYKVVTDGAGDGIGIYVDFKDNNDENITIIFHDSGFVSIYTGNEEKHDQT